MYIFVCEDSIDGIFTGIYDAWASKYGLKNICLTTNSSNENLNLFYQYVSITTDVTKSQKVAKTLMERLGEDVYGQLCQAAVSTIEKINRNEQLQKADAIYKTVVFGLSLTDGSKVLNYLGDPYVNYVFKLSRATGNEAHHLTGFLRFAELENGVLFAKIHPKNNVLPILAEHFTDRFPLENFIIYDENRKLAAIHKKEKHYMLADVPDASLSYMNQLSEGELEYRKLWCGFFDNITIESRKNSRLQSQNFPKRFWKDAIEMTYQR